jgi:hypothetical protein
MTLRGRPRIRGGSGSLEAPISREQRTVLRTAHGLLPAVAPGPILGGSGSGAPCNGCGDAILHGDIEYEVIHESTSSLLFHRGCFSPRGTRISGAPHRARRRGSVAPGAVDDVP